MLFFIYKDFVLLLALVRDVIDNIKMLYFQYEEDLSFGCDNVVVYHGCAVGVNWDLKT